MEPRKLLAWLDWMGWFLSKWKCFSSDASMARGGCNLLRYRAFLPPAFLAPFLPLPWRFAGCLRCCLTRVRMGVSAPEPWQTQVAPLFYPDLRHL